MAIDLWRTRPFMSNPMGRAVDRLFEEAFAPFYGGRDGGAGGSGQTGVQTLPVTIWETPDAFHAALMAPGPVLLKLAATGFGVRLPPSRDRVDR